VAVLAVLAVLAAAAAAAAVEVVVVVGLERRQEVVTCYLPPEGHHWYQLQVRLGPMQASNFNNLPRVYD
jgi:hypothetical protein